MLEDRPEDLLGEGGIAKLVGVGEVVLGGRGRSAEGGEGTGVEAKGIAEIVEADGVNQLGIDEGDDMTPGGKGPRLFIDPGVLGQGGNEEGWNEIEELAENRQIRGRWRWSRFWFFHPCRVAVKPVSVSIFASRLWDGCVSSFRFSVGPAAAMQCDFPPDGHSHRPAKEPAWLRLTLRAQSRGPAPLRTN